MKRNAFFQLIHKEDGVYLKSYPPLDGGMPLTAEDILQYLGKKKLEDILVEDIQAFVQKAMTEKNAEMKIISGSILPENEYPLITVDSNCRLAKVRLYPPTSKGNRISVQELKDLLSQQGVRHGIIDSNLEILLKGRIYCTDVLVAKAQMPIHGKNATITYHFNVDKTCKPQIGDDGSVDFHKLDMIETVTEGQLLATLTPMDPGEPGIDVSGAPIKAKKVEQLFLKCGKNIRISEDKLEMYSMVSGNVTLINDTVFVSNVYEVPADVGASTGDVEYDGSVLVKGNVLTGYTIKATGDITVNGVVEGATLIAGGKIVLKRGVQGMGKAIMEAKGDIISNFIESATVKSEGKIITDAIMHSKIVSKDDIKVHGKRGLIAGGSIRTKTRIETKTAGSSMGTTTELEVGIDPSVTERYRFIEKEMESLANEKDSLTQNLNILKKRMDANRGKLNDEKKKMLLDIGKKMKEIDEKMQTYSEEYDTLGEELGKQSDGKIIVENIAFPGVKITISNVVSHIHTEAQHCAFVREGADIRIKGI